MNIVVTGATSFLGVPMVRQLLAGGHRVWAVVRPQSAHLSHLLEQVAEQVPEQAPEQVPRQVSDQNQISDQYKGRLQIISLDLSNLDQIQTVMRAESKREADTRMAGAELESTPDTKMDAWIHIGWEGAGSDNRTQRDVQQANVGYALAAVRAAAELGCRRFLFTGSQAEYGVCRAQADHSAAANQTDYAAAAGQTDHAANADRTDRSAAEKAGYRPITEQQACHPVSEYGIAKMDFYRQAVPLCEKLQMEYIHTRIFSVYGPGDHPWTLVQSCLRSWERGETIKLGECTQQWNFLYIEDTVEALICLLTDGRPGVYNIASEDTRPLRAYIEEMYELCGRRGGFSYGERPQNAEGPADLMPDIRKLREETGWKPKTTFAEGIYETLHSMREGAAKAQSV
ncbi:MAG: NAD(P)-dependent oxidoreductase [Lachnospiraceae bacterium]|nr:NAD(P)-dependent oxidoreductase [Lachnospiraceae bacterium]